MHTERHDDGSITYTLSENEKYFITMFVFFVFGRATGYNKGRKVMAKEIRKTGMPQP